jgi:hypothetical protein
LGTLRFAQPTGKRLPIFGSGSSGLGLFGFCAFGATHHLGGVVAVGARFIERLIQRLSRDKSRSYRGQLRFLVTYQSNDVKT